MPRLFFLLSGIFFLLQLTNCNKHSTDTPPAAEQPEFSFTYNGQTYSGMNYCAVMLDGGSRLEGVHILKEDILGGKIIYYTQPGCAYLQPTGTLISPNMPGCLLTNYGGSIIDSSRVFIYRSGSINLSYSNCVHKKYPNIIFGGFFEYDECTVTGDFSLLLGNNSGQTKSITGLFKFVGIRR